MLNVFRRFCRFGLSLFGRAPQRTRGEMLVQHLRGRGDVGFTTDQIMELTRGDESSSSA